jgi:hypothetical protein
MDKEWRNEDGDLHRLDGPAIEWEDGTKQWRVNGKLHRLDGPAVEFADGYKIWWIVGKKFTKKAFEKHPLVIFYRLSTNHTIAQ